MPPPSIETDDQGRAVVVKAGSGDTALRRRREADILRRAQHPGVVQLLELRDREGEVELRLDHVAGPSLSTHPPLGATRLASVGTAVATTLADIHQIGVVHGNINADHILLTGDGRVVLCGFADGALARAAAGAPGPMDEVEPGSPDGDAATRDGLPPRVDVIELGRLLRRLLDQSIDADVVPPRSVPGDRLGRVADSAADPEGPITNAAELARRLSELVGPEDRAPSSSRPTPTRRSRHRILMGAGAVLGIVLAIAGWRLVDPGDDGSQESPSSSTTAPFAPSSTTAGASAATGPEARSPGAAGNSDATAPVAQSSNAASSLAGTSPGPADGQDAELLLPAAPHCERVTGRSADVDGDGCPEAWSVGGGELEVGGRQYLLGGPADLLALGDWDCDGAATPALVEVSSGAVFLFGRWATEGAEVTVPAAGQVSAPTGLDVVRTGGCDRLVVTSSSGDQMEFAGEEDAR